MNYSIEEIFDKLIGTYTAHGDSHYDEESLKNLETVHSLVTSIVSTLKDNTICISNYQMSMQDVATKSYHILNDVMQLSTDACKDYKKRLYKDDYHFPKFRQIEALPKVYKLFQRDVIVSPNDINYTLEWYQKEIDPDATTDDIVEIKLFKPDLSANGMLKPNYVETDKEVQYWDTATQEEQKYLGTNLMVQPNVSVIGTIKNIYGDIYTLKTLYDAIEEHKEIEDPILLCSTEF